MAPRIDPAVIKTQIDSVMAEVAGIKAALEKLNGARAPTDFDSMAEAAASAVTAASPGGTSVAGGALLPLTDAQRRICVCVINVFETGKVEGDYSAISIFTDGPNRMRQVTYGRSQTTEYGNLRELISDYVNADGTFSDALRPFVDTIGTKVGNPPRSPLVDDQTFLSLLRRAGADPVMQRTQDAFFDRVYLDPALRWGAQHGFTKALSALVIYDSFAHSGGILGFLRQRFEEPVPSNGGDEKTWIAQYVAVRQNWLATASNPDLHPTVYRTKDLTREINRGNWDLAVTPIMANGVPVVGRTPVAPSLEAVAAFPRGAALLDEAGAASAADFVQEAEATLDDPAAPDTGEDASLTDVKAANFGVSIPFEEAMAAAAPAVVSASVAFDLSRAKQFLNACMAAGVKYGLGKKVPHLGAVPGRDFTQVDCSGFVREAIRLSTTPTFPFPDGSVVQHDWVRAHGFPRLSVPDGRRTDGIVRVAFLRPQDSAHGIGHVVLISAGKTLESHSSVGPDSRVWDGGDWQSKAFVYELARDGRLSLPGGVSTTAMGAASINDAVFASAPNLAMEATAFAAASQDSGAIDRLVSLGSSPQSLRAAQSIAAQRLLAFDGETFPHDGCAITLSVLLQQAGIPVSDTFTAIEMGQVLLRRGWRRIPVGQQQRGDMGSTCGPVAHHGTDHIYLVLRDVNDDEMVIADNQDPAPHFRFASGRGRSPTTFFLRAGG